MNTKFRRSLQNTFLASATDRLKDAVLVAAVLAMVAIVPACNDSSPTSPSAPASIDGTWDLTITEAPGVQFPRGFAFTAVATFAQSGVSVSGTFLAATEGLSGDVTGSVSGSSFTFRVAQREPCAGTFNGRAAVQASNRQMSGNYNGSFCGGIIQANFTATKRR